jgi:hypothetical protein
VQAHGAAAQAVAGDEFDLGVVGVFHPVAAHFQAQPLGGGVKVERRGAVAGVPGGQQVVGPLAHKGGVARTHEAFGIGRRPQQAG